ncbi:hypothetical protein [Geodermatophilus sp. SYSU D00698]
MTEQHVLAHLARRFARSEEVIATETLTWVLRRSPAARAAVIDSARSLGAELPADLDFSGQVSDSETGRPDVVGTDEQGRERLLIEAKFAAALTEHQPGGYLRRLPLEETGMLLVVAPERRQASLWSELVAALPGAGPAPAPSTAAPTRASLETGRGHRLALTSWRRLVTGVLDAVEQAGERRLGQDVRQLLALTEAMDDRAYEPVRPEDLNQQVGRQVHQLRRLVDASCRHLLELGVLQDASRRESHRHGFSGWGVATRSTGKRLWFGYWSETWADHGVSPLWAEVFPTPLWSRRLLQQALAPFAAAGGVGLFERDRSLAVPLVLPASASEDETIRSLVDQVTTIADLLAAVAPAGASGEAETEPQTLAADSDDPEP